MAARVFRITRTVCPDNEPHPGCTISEYRVAQHHFVCALFTRLTGHKFTGTKRFKLVEVKAPRKRG